MKHFNITVYGKVQGVFYRQSTLEMAKQFGIKGFVRNGANGNVYIEAEATVEELKKLVEWCKSGPVRAIVSQVEFLEGDLKNFTSFTISR